MLGYIHTHSCYFFSPSLPVNLSGLIIRDNTNVDTILHLIDSIVYKPGNYEDLINIPATCSAHDSVLLRLMQLLGEDEYKLMLNHIIEFPIDPPILDDIWYHASKYYKLELNDYYLYPYLAHCLPYDADDYQVEDYFPITDRSARWFLSHNIPDQILSNQCEHLSVSVLEETIDFILKNPDTIKFDIDWFVEMCRNRGCNFTGREGINEYINTPSLE